MISKRHALIGFAVGLMIGDILATGAYWHYETNPLALELGKWFFLSLKALLIPVFVVTFETWYSTAPRVASGLLIGISGLYMTVLATNIMVII